MISNKNERTYTTSRRIRFNSNKYMYDCGKFKKSRDLQAPIIGRCKFGFPLSITVDQLSSYRKRRPAYTWPHDNLTINKGEFKTLKSEYKSRFKNFCDVLNNALNRREDALSVRPVKPEISLKLEGSHDFQSEYNESFTKQPMESSTELDIMDNEISISQLPATETTSLIRSNIIRPPLLKRPTNLKIEGEFVHVTEHAENFIEYLLTKRSDLLRTPTTLKLEGDMDTKTESRDKFIKYDKLERAPLCRHMSNLHLEGDHVTVTENQEKYLPYEVSRRPPLTKKPTNLHLEGNLNLVPEYRRQYIDYKSLERAKPTLPANNLKSGGLFESTSDEIKLFDRKMHPFIPFLRDTDKRHDDSNDHRRTSNRTRTDRRQSNTLDSSKSMSHPNLNYMRRGNISLEGNLDMNPEYKKSYVDFYKQGGISPNVRNKRQSELNYMKDDNKMEINPEYSSSYVNFPRQRPYIRRPEGHLYSEGEVSHVTEKSEKYLPHMHIERTEMCKREPELKLEGRFECQPEYRKAYIDYLIREKNTPTTQRRRAFDLVSGDNENLNVNSGDNISDTSSSATKEKVLPNKRDGETSKSTLNIPTIVKDSSSYTSSAPSSPKLNTKALSSAKLSQMETTAFGPKCSQPRNRRTLTPSPSPKLRRNSKSKLSRNSSPNLAQRNAVMPEEKINLWQSSAAKKLSSSEPTRWNDSVEGDTAFLILEDKVPSKRVATNSLYKEQKWMPSWNYGDQ